MKSSIIKLKNVSKYYYSKGVIALGFSRINLEFNMGEFVAITGESGSGKSTLLNVISGLDTYEEGEMYINGSETSHYTEQDFEEYRRKNIGFIFQNFNLVNSYTVYQNIELVLLLNGEKRKAVKKKVIELIKKVNLYKFRNTKVSKLSGGQKQRVAIARALAKDTPIIIADEPTGNLDSKSAKDIIKLLSDISKNKLVIIVTHNYEQVESYVTRKIKMHDGKILEDKKIKEYKEVLEENTNNYKNIRFLSKIRLGIRNTFNIIPKFLLVLGVYFLITMALLSEYSTFKVNEYLADKTGVNYIFTNAKENRIVIKKQDKTVISNEDYDKIYKLDNIEYITKNDLLLDTYISLTDSKQEFWLNPKVNNIKNFKGKIDIGRLPENDNEIVVIGSRDDYYLGYDSKNTINKEVYINDDYTGEQDKTLPLKIVGISYADTSDLIYMDNTEIYVSNIVEDKLKYQINKNYSILKVLFNNKYHESNLYNPEFKIVSNSKVPEGNVYIAEELNYTCPKENCKNQDLIIEVDNIYYKDTLNLKVDKTYNKRNLETILGLKNYEEIYGNIFINENDYKKLFNKGNYQSSVFVKNMDNIDNTIKSLNDLGFTTLKLKDTMAKKTEALGIIKIFKTIVTIILVVVLFFISYFVISLILKSRNVYFTTIRILGATKRISRQLLIIELLNVATIAYILSLLLIYLNKIKIYSLGLFTIMNDYLKFSDYIILYIILMIMSFILSLKFSKKLFKNSAMKTLKESV